MPNLIDMNIVFLTEGKWDGYVDRNHPNMRTDLAWQFALNAEHHHLYAHIRDFDLVIVIIPKKCEDGNFDIKLWIDHFEKNIQPYNKKIAVMQEGPQEYFQDYRIETQLAILRFISEVDIIFCHNEYDRKYYQGLFHKSPVHILPTLMIEDSIPKNLCKPEDRSGTMIGGNWTSWYSGVDSYMMATLLDEPIYCPSMGRKQPDEDLIDAINYLPYMNWSEWMVEVSKRKYAVHLMRTYAAGSFNLNCFSTDTEILTQNGIKKIIDCVVGDLVYSLSPDRKVELKPIIGTICRSLQSDEKVYQITGRSVDFVATDNHDFIKQTGTGKLKRILAKDVVNSYKFKFPDSFPIDDKNNEYIDITSLMNDDEYIVFYLSFNKFKKTFESQTGVYLSYNVLSDFTRRDIDYSLKRDPFVRISIKFFRKFKLDLNGFDCNIYVKRTLNEYANLISWRISIKDFFMLLGLYISEGYTNKDEYRIGIAQSKNRIRGKSRYNIIKDKLNWLNVAESSNQFYISSPILNRILGDNCGRGALNKKIPKWVFEYSSTLLIYLFNGLMIGDGSADMSRYYTSSDQLRDDFCKLCIHLGRGFSISYNSYPTNFKSNKPGYIIYVRKSTGSFLRNSLTDIPIKYNGDVCCVEVADNQSMMAGRNGKFQWVGNCAKLGIPCIGYDSIDTQRLCFPELSFPEGDMESIRKAIKHLKENDLFYNHVAAYAKKIVNDIYSESEFRRRFFDNLKDIDA